MIIMSLPYVNGYDVVERVGVGSFSVVYKAYTKVNIVLTKVYQIQIFILFFRLAPKTLLL